MEYEELIEQLRKDGYIVTEVDNDPYHIIKGNGVRGAIGTEGAYSRYIANRIAFDNERCFDKIQKCPLIMKLPVDYEELKKHIEFLASDEGYEHSNKYGEGILPMEIDW